MASPTIDRRFGLVGNAAIKAPVLVVATANVVLSREQTIDGVAAHALNASSVPDRVLCVGQTNPIENGIYDVSTSAWSRSPDADGSYDLAKGSTVFVTDGVVYAGWYWQLQTTGPIVPGTTAMTWATVLTAVTTAAANAAIATAQATIATNQAAIATTQSGIATTQAGLATTARAAAEAAEAAALAAAKLYADYATAVAATADGDFFSLYAADLVARLIYKRVTGQGELQGVQPFLRQQTAEAARLLASSSTYDAATTLPAGARVDFVPVDSLYGYINLRNRAWLTTQTTPDLNLLGRSRPNEFPAPNVGGEGSFGVTNVTAAFGTAGQDAALKAVRVQYAGSGAAAFNVQPLSAGTTLSIPPGRWTFAYDVISNSGGSSSYRMYSAPSGSYGTVTATTSWSTVSQTFVITAFTPMSGGWQLFREAASPAVVDITIDNLRLIPGSAAGSASVLAEHLWRPHGLATFDGLTPRGTSSSDTGNRALVPLSASAAFTGVAVIMALRKEGNGANRNFALTDSNFAASGFLLADMGTNPGIDAGIGGGLGSDMSGLPLNNWIIVGFSGGTDGSKLFVNGIKVTQANATPLTSFTTDYFSVAGLASRQDANFFGKYGSVRVHTRSTLLTDAEMAREFAVAKTRLAAIGEQFTDFGSFYIAEGDSITAGTGATAARGYAKLLGQHFTPYLQGIDYGVPGNVLANLTARASTIDAKIAEAISLGKRALFSVLIGANEMPASTGAADTYYAALKVYWAARRATGAKVIASTTIDGSGYSGAQETARAYLNGLIRGDTSQYDGLADYAANANLNTWSGTYFADAQHPNDTGHALMETILRPIVTGLWLP